MPDDGDALSDVTPSTAPAIADTEPDPAIEIEIGTETDTDRGEHTESGTDSSTGLDLETPTELEPAEPEPEPSVRPDPTPPPAPFPPPFPEPPSAEIEEAPIIVIKTLLGILALIVVAYLGGHPKVRVVEARLGISRVVAAGFPFLVLGLVAASEPVGVLSPQVIEHLRPLLHLGLGWVGLTVGMRVDLGRMGELPRGTPAILAMGTGLPFAMIVAGTGLLLLLVRAWNGDSVLDPALVRNALVLGTAGAMAADTEAIRIAMRSAGEAIRERVGLLASLDEAAGLVGLIFLTAYFRPASSWQIPGTAWMFVTLGLPACLAAVVYLMLRIQTTSSELMALLLGSVAFVAGIASTLLLSALVVCFVVGVLLANFPGEYHGRVREVLGRLEAPIYLLFLLVAGARWQPSAVLGWGLVVVLIAARLPGRWLGAHLAWKRSEIDLPPHARRALALCPLGTLPIAIVVNAELLYPADTALPSIVTAVIGATIALEFFAQLYWRSPELSATVEEPSR